MMKRVFITLLFLYCAGNLFAQYKMELNGFYQGRNVYIQNPFNADGIGFCVDSISVNGIGLKGEKINASAFEIDLPAFNVKYGDSIAIVLYHSGDCMPKVLNPFITCHPKCTLKDARVDSAGVFQFVTCEENGRILYTVEQFRWNKWVKIGEVESNGNFTDRTYTFDVKPYLHKGKNKFRAKMPYNKQISQTAEYNADLPEIIVDAATWCNVIAFSRETLYELYDKSGNIVKKGFGTQVDYSGQKPGVYFLNYDDKSEKVKLKKCTREEKKNAPGVKNGVSVYPNPASTEITVSTDTSYAGAFLAVEIVDAKGVRVKYTEIRGGEPVGISVAELADGMYVVQVFRGNTRVSSQKIAVRH